MFVGSGTVPGVGVPMVLVSGKLAAERVDRYAQRGPMRRPRVPAFVRKPATSMELAAQARTPVTLEDTYELCRQLNRRHGTTYYWSTLVLPKVKRHHVHALYGFCRYADDIVDEPSARTTPDGHRRGPREGAADFGRPRFFADLDREAAATIRSSRPSCTR